MNKYTWSTSNDLEFVVYAEDIDEAKEKAHKLQEDSREGTNSLYVTRIEEVI